MKINHCLVALLLVNIVFSCKKKDAGNPGGDNSLGFTQAYYPFPADVGKVVYESNIPLTRKVGSPSILVLSNGDYLISHTYDGATMVHISKNKGKSWEFHSRVSPLNFATLFEHRGEVFLMGTSVPSRGDIVIYKSKDQGKSWSSPTDENNGLLAKGLFHSAPVPVVKHNGKIWRAYEEVFSVDEDRDFHAFAMCADENVDLLKATSWKRTNSIRFDESWINARRPNWLEGNIVVSPDNKLINFMRLETGTGSGVQYEISGVAAGKPRNEIAAVIDINEDDMKVTFSNKARNFVHFPGAESKFTIRYDPVSKMYWTITNKISSFRDTPLDTYDGNWHQRNVLVLMSSPDLNKWEVQRKILRWNEGAHLRTWDTFGFQYIDWQFDDKDIVFVSRTSWYGDRYHDANMITFHSIANFRAPNSQEPEDLLKYTQHPKLLDIPVTAITNGNWQQQDMDIKILRGDGIMFDEEGKITLKNQLISADENQAIKAFRYFDIAIKNNKESNFSVETLDYSTSANTRKFRLKWMYSTDGVIFHPITNYLLRVESSSEGIKFTPPLYLPVYSALQNIDGKKGVVLRCAIVNGNGTGLYMKFNDNISIGGRVL